MIRRTICEPMELDSPQHLDNPESYRRGRHKGLLLQANG
jgi:hypothetical protein